MVGFGVAEKGKVDSDCAKSLGVFSQVEDLLESFLKKQSIAWNSCGIDNCKIEEYNIEKRCSVRSCPQWFRCCSYVGRFAAPFSWQISV